CQSSLGKKKGRDNSDSYQEKRPAHAGRAKKALPVNEGSLGGKKESRGHEESSCEEKRPAHAGRAKKALPVNEGSLGSQKESRSEVISHPTGIARFLFCLLLKVGLGNEAYCSREDSNLHGFPHTVLSRPPLPIPPREQQAAALQCARTRRPARLNQRHCDWNEARDIWLN